MQNPADPSGSFGFFWLFLLSSIIGTAVYLELSFPHDLRDIYPEKFESHPARDMKPFMRDFREMNPIFFNQTVVGISEDVEIDKNGNGYCVNHKNDVVMLDTQTKEATIVGKIPEGKSFGIRLSIDENSLYIINDKMGLIEFNFETKKVNTVVNQYKGEFLSSLDAVEVHPTNPNILYFTQASERVNLDIYIIDIMLNNPFGKVFEYNKETKEVSLLADGLYFANGIVFQKYKNQETVLVSETNRFRLTRIFVSGENRGYKEIAVDKLDFYVDNVKMNEKGQIWVAGPSGRDSLLAFADRHPWVRRIMSRLPFWLIKLVSNPNYFGGVKIIFSEDKQSYKLEYHLWEKLQGFNFSTTVNERNDRLFISSLSSASVWYVPEFNKRIQTIKSRQKEDGKSAEEL